MASTPVAAAHELAAVLDTPFLRALAEPARLEVIKVLLVHGTGDVASIAARLPQDRSVISRHLQTLEQAGIVTSTRAGRRRLYTLDGSSLVSRFEALSGRIKALAPLCCPPAATPGTAATRKSNRRR